MPEITCLETIPFDPDHERLIESLCLSPDTEDASEFRTLFERLQPIIRPRALFAEAFIDQLEEESVTIDGVLYRSRVLARNLEGIHRVFPYIATCGPEIDNAEDSKDDLLVQYWIDAIKAEALTSARTFIAGYLSRTFATGNLSSMNPGSGDVDVWPIEQQRLLFTYFGDTESMIGVRLTPSCLMIPNKSVSGIFFPSDVSFSTCSLCHRQNCVGRRAEFDPDEFERVSTRVPENAE
jgi:hypothetical protein